MDPKEKPSLWNDHVAPLDQRAARRHLSRSVVNSQKSSTTETTVAKVASKPSIPCATAFKAELNKMLDRGNRFIRNMMHAPKGVLF